MNRETSLSTKEEKQRVSSFHFRLQTFTARNCLIMTTYWKELYLAIAIAFLSAVHVYGQLKPGGRNVCHKKVSYNAYENRRFTRIGYDNYRTCCKKKWGICTSRCTRYRSKIVTYYNSVLVVRHRDTYFCCVGWAAAGSECTKAICSPPCQNGNCVTPNKCSCKAGFQGKLCESDINECAKNPCQQICNNLPGTYTCSCKKGFTHPSSNPKDPVCKDVNECTTKPCKCAPGTPGCIATCENQVGSFRCKCNAGFQLTGGVTCTDIDECSSSSHGCAQRCLNNPGSYSCACNSGFVLAADKKKCNDVNECSKLNGGCSQRCINQVGKYYCACNTGFELKPDKKTCVDINECTRNKPCDPKNGICENTRGSYTCKCKTGYALQADKKTCKDIDECSSSSLNACAHNCQNTDGSYVCSCKKGYRLTTDKRGCDDINECSEKSATCQHNCHNNVGSYTCSCRPGYKLEGDGRKCKALPCQKITPPKNGQMKCTGYVTDESCDFSCDKGFNLFGASTRKCLPTAVWSDEKTSCQPKPCPKIKPPLHGSVLLPCVEEYNSTCLLKCSRGFYLAGKRNALCVVESGKTKWQLGGSSCKAVEACTPNPCDHGGRCTVLGIKKFSCSCDGTGYTGKTCNTGIVRTPLYPKLTVNEKSEILYLRARPDNEITVTPVTENGAAIFEPSSVLIFKNIGEGRFKVTAKKAGEFRIKYKVTGQDASFFLQPADDVVYAVIKRKVSKAVSLKADFFASACKTRSISGCGSGPLQLSSTCNWGRETAGFVAVGDKSFQLPVSPVGLQTSTAEKIYRNGLFSAANEVSNFLDKQILPSCANWGKCPGYEYDVDTVNYLISNNLFAEGYYRKFMSILPYWVNVAVNRAAKSFNPRDIFSSVGKGGSLTAAALCPGFVFDSNSVYSVYTPEKQPILTFLSSKKIIKGKTGKCLSVDLCKQLAHFSTPMDDGMSLTDDFASLGLGFIKASSYGFSFGSFGKKCVRLGGGVNKCVNSNSYWNLVGSLSMTKESKVEFNGRFDAELSDINNALLQRLYGLRKLHFAGKLIVDTEINLLGSKLKIKSVEEAGKGYIQVGGSPKACPVCSGNGIHLVLNSDDNLFKYGVSTLKFKPSTDTVQLSLLKDGYGGKVTSIENLNRLSLSLRLLGTLNTLFKKLQGAMGTGFADDAKLISKRSALLIDVANRGINVTSQNGADFKTVDMVIRSLKRASIDLMPVLRNLQQRLGSDAASVKIEGPIVSLMRRLAQIEALEVLAKSEAIAVTSQGSLLKYDGDLCIHQLCFTSQSVTVYDIQQNAVTDDACKTCQDGNVKKMKADSVLISAVASKDAVLGKKVRLRKGNKIALYASRKSNVVTGSFEGEINLFKRFYPATFTFSEKTFTVAAKNVQVTNSLVFDISGSNDVRKVSWDDVIRNLNGRTSNGSSIVSQLTKLAQEYYFQTGKTTQIRIKRSADRQRKANIAVQEQQKAIHLAQMKLKNASDSQRLARLAYQRQLVLLNRTQIELRSYMKDLTPLFIEKSLDGVCKLTNCKETCISVPVCKVCQDPVKTDVNTLKCEPASEIIRTNVVQSYKAKCELRKYVFIPVYTGSCAEDPGMAAARDRQLQQNLASTGAATGALIGSVIPGIGTVLGGVIGGIVGFVGGLFSSCDKSYEVYTKTWTVQVDCTRTHNVVKTVNRAYSECFYVKKTVKTGYDQPQQCNCTTNPCLTKVKEPACLIQNTKCQELRAEFLKHSDKIPKKFTDTHNKVEQLKNNVKAAFVVVKKTTKEKTFYQDEYNRAVIFGKHRSQDSKIADQSQANVLSLLSTENCISRHYNKSSILSDHLRIEYMTFDSALPLIDNLRLDAYVRNSGRGKTGTVPFVLQFEDKDLSLLAAAKKIVRRELCNAARKRRSVNEVDHDDVAFTSWYIDSAQNASTVQKACLTFESTTGYLKHIFENLQNLTLEGELLGRKIKTSKGNLGLSNTFGVSSGDSNVIVSAQRDEINSLANSLDVAESRTRPDEVQKLWIENSEIYTGLNNVTVCLNMKDCLEVTFESLAKLPTMFRVKRSQYLSLVDRARQHAEEALKKGKSLDKLRYHAQEIRRIVVQLETVSLLCTDPPKATIECDEKYIAKEGELVTLTCKAKSELPVQFVWKRGKDILEDETRNYLRFEAHSDKEGFYTCTVVSLAGNSTTNGTLVVVEHGPKFTSEPQDTIYYNPSPKDYLTSFTCNVTANPEANIEWFYLPLTGPEVARRITGQPGSIFALARPRKSNAGYYFCKAHNKHGSVTSRKARLDVVNLALADQKILFSFDVHGAIQNLSTASFENLAQRMKIDSQLTVTVSFSSKSSSEGSIVLTAYVTPNVTSLNSSELLLASAAKARQALANSLSTLLADILLAKSTIKTVNGLRLSVDNETMKHEFFGNICKAGYTPKKDGFMCAECPAGTFEKNGKCFKCKIGQYQSSPGQTKCTLCYPGEVTQRTGSTNMLSCVHPRFLCSNKHDGQYKHPGDCTKFVSCVGGITYIMDCPNGLYYDEKSNRCDWPRNVKCDV